MFGSRLVDSRSGRLATMVVAVAIFSLAILEGPAQAQAKTEPYIRVVDEDGGRIVRLRIAARRFEHPGGRPRAAPGCSGAI